VAPCHAEGADYPKILLTGVRSATQGTPTLAQGVNHPKHELRHDVFWPEIDDADKRRPGADGGAAEGEIMADDDVPLVGCAFENLCVALLH